MKRHLVFVAFVALVTGSSCAASNDETAGPTGGSSGSGATSGVDGGGASGDSGPSSCSDGVRNGSESDVDCGWLCPKCADGKQCGAGPDCASGICEGAKCQPGSCTDTVKNGAETDVDCGGSSCDKCEVCRQCQQDEDCAPGLCETNLCGPTIEIVSAVYAANCGAPTTVQKILDECNGKKTCNYSFNYSNDLGFDPAYGCMKDLKIEYKCSGGTTTKTFYESCAPCDPQNTPTEIHLELECDPCLGLGKPPA